MSYAVKLLQDALYRQLFVQAVLIVAVSAGFFAVKGLHAVPAAAFGGLIAVVNTLLQLWQLRRSGRVPADDVGRNMRFLIRCAAERFVAVLALFALGLGVVRLEALPLLSGFVAGQLALLFGGLKNRI